MTERFVTSGGTISISTGDTVAVGVGTTFSGLDRGGAQLWAQPPDAAPFRIGSVAEVNPSGVYDNLGLPLVTAYNGPDYEGPYELVDGLALAGGATQAAVYARFAAFLEQNMGLTGNTADAIDYSRVPNNALFVDAVTRTIYQWRNGVLEVVSVIGAQWVPRGAWSGVVQYDLNNLVQRGNYIFVSNADENLNFAPNTAPASTAYWTYVPLPTVQQVLDVLGIHQITVSTNFPAGGQDGDLWFKVS